MSTIYLVRHGQASFGAANYDVLSDTGAAQSRELGRYWAGREQHLDAIYVGPRTRQKDTATHLAETAHAAGLGYPEAVELDNFDEYPAFELLAHWLPILQRDDPSIGELLSNPPRPGESTARFDRVFESIIGRWASGELTTGELESFEDFTGRVERGLAQIMDQQGRGKTIAVVTSGGPISVAMRWALGL